MSLQNKIFDTILYSNYFEYPLTLSEVTSFLHSKEKVSISEIERKIKSIKDIETKNNYYFLKGRSFLIDKRKQREGYSEEKFRIAQKFGNIIFKIPTVKLIGISGSLALKNSEKDDDIDLLVVTSRNKIWTTRLVLITILKILGVHRGRKSKEVKNKICLNLFLDESYLSLNRRSSLFLAHEIVQFLPLFDRDKTYLKLIEENSWIGKFLSNYKFPAVESKRTNFFQKRLIQLIDFLKIEKIAKKIQMSIMSTKDNSSISDSILAFYPLGRERKVLGSYQKLTRGH